MYEKTEAFWDDIFGKEELKDLSKPFGIEKMDSCMAGFAAIPKTL
ncbi:MAG TPA: hypothetical protein PK845_04080 [Petrotogaceae bacterium]|nr:hypothetical protein [Petrotogaceae bacterium]